MSEKGQVRKSMFSVQNMEELGRLYESDTPVLAYDFERRMVSFIRIDPVAEIYWRDLPPLQSADF
jgi:hypothetical protein